VRLKTGIARDLALFGAAIEPGEGLVDTCDGAAHRSSAEAGQLGTDATQRRHLLELIEPAERDLGPVPSFTTVLEGAVIDLS
jgi:hypothetical protein